MDDYTISRVRFLTKRIVMLVSKNTTERHGNSIDFAELTDVVEKARELVRIIDREVCQACFEKRHSYRSCREVVR